MMRVPNSVSSALLALSCVCAGAGCTQSQTADGAGAASHHRPRAVVSRPKRTAADAGTDAADAGDDVEFTVPQVQQPGDAGAERAPLLEVMRPEVVGTLAGPGATLDQGKVLYGTDMGMTFQHHGKLFIVFGDAWLTSAVCGLSDPHNDDPIAMLPASYTGGIPKLTFVTEPGSSVPRFIEVHRGATSLTMGWGRTPLAVFSDGAHAFGVFGRDEQSTCETNSGEGAQTCSGNPELACSITAGLCQPPAGVAPELCDAATRAGCYPLQQCVLQTPGFCVDPTSSLLEGHAGDDRFGVTDNIDIGVQRSGSPQIFDSGFVFATNKFRNAYARTVRKLSGHVDGNDYRSGSGALLMWGRPAWWAEHGQQAQLYLLMHELPLAVDDAGRIRFEPRFFAGVDPESGEPAWSSKQTDAKPLALDGRIDGDPHEDLSVVNQMTVSWLGAPIHKWVMIYAGDMFVPLLSDPAGDEWSKAPGALAMRFADHPWGPWSPPQPHLLPGDPSKVGDNFGPGGTLFHYACVDQPPAMCARTDPIRPFDTLVPGCPTPPVQMDVGHFYAPNIIDEYTTRRGENELEIMWNVSTWNPYKVILVKTRIRAGESSTPG